MGSRPGQTYNTIEVVSVNASIFARSISLGDGCGHCAEGHGEAEEQHHIEDTNDLHSC